MTRAATYARVSTQDQAGEDRTSLSEQAADMERYCSEKGYEIVARYQDIGSGATKNRRDFQRMLSDAAAGIFDVVICWKSDRLSRGIYPAAALSEVVEAYDLRIESVNDTIDMNTFHMYALVGKIELDNLRERTSMGKRGAAKQGRIPRTSACYGYFVNEDHKLEIHPDEGPVVQRMFDEYVNRGHGSKIIADGLTADGIPTRGSSKYGKWSTSVVIRILGKEEYTGKGWYGRRRAKTTERGRVVRITPRESWIPVEYPRLIDDATWSQAQLLKVERLAKSHRNTKVFYLLQGLMICQECGLGFACRANHRNTKRVGDRTYRYEFDSPLRYYVCNGKLSHGMDCREHPYFKAETLEGLVWGEVERVLLQPELITHGISAVADDSRSDETAKIELSAAERVLSDVQTEEDRLIRLHVTGKITESQLDRQRKFITARLKQAEKNVAELSSRRFAARDRAPIAVQISTWCEKVKGGLKALLPDERKEILGLLLDGVVIDRVGNVRMTLAIPTNDSMSIATQTPTCLHL